MATTKATYNVQGFSKAPVIWHGQSICRGCNKPAKFLRARNKKLHLCSVCLDKLDRGKLTLKEVSHESNHVGAATQSNGEHGGA